MRPLVRILASTEFGRFLFKLIVFTLRIEVRNLVSV